MVSSPFRTFDFCRSYEEFAAIEDASAGKCFSCESDDTGCP